MPALYSSPPLPSTLPLPSSHLRSGLFHDIQAVVWLLISLLMSSLRKINPCLMKYNFRTGKQCFLSIPQKKKREKKA